MTVAPKSERMRVQCGPDRMRVRSMTMMLDNGPFVDVLVDILFRIHCNSIQVYGCTVGSELKEIDLFMFLFEEWDWLIALMIKVNHVKNKKNLFFQRAGRGCFFSSHSFFSSFFLYFDFLFLSISLSSLFSSLL